MSYRAQSCSANVFKMEKFFKMLRLYGMIPGLEDQIKGDAYQESDMWEILSGEGTSELTKLETAVIMEKDTRLAEDGDITPLDLAVNYVSNILDMPVEYLQVDCDAGSDGVDPGEWYVALLDYELWDMTPTKLNKELTAKGIKFTSESWVEYG